MTKHGVVLGPEDAIVAAAAAARHFSFPPPRTGDSCRKLAAQIDLGTAVMGPWLDSMKASSPRHRLMAPVAAGDSEHDDWMERHPSALDRFDALEAAAKGKQIAVFLDYDGTLSPIVEDPDRAVMTDEMREAVRVVAAHFPTAIVSGRCRDKRARAGVRLRAAGGAVLRREPRDGHTRAHCGPQPPRHPAQPGQVGALPTCERVPADDRGGLRRAGREGGVDPGLQGGEQQVLPLGPLPLRRREDMGSAGGAGEVRAPGLPQAAADAGQEGAGGSPHDQVGQGQGPRVPARVARVRRAQRRVPYLHRRRPHRRGCVQGAAQPGTGRWNPRVQVPQGDQRVLLPPRAS